MKIIIFRFVCNENDFSFILYLIKTIIFLLVSNKYDYFLFCLW